MKHKGFMLVELLAMLVVFAVVSAALGYLWRDLAWQIPRIWNQTNTAIQWQGFVAQLQSDVEASQSLRLVDSNDPNVVRVILMVLPDQTIRYEQNGTTKAIRRIGKPGEDGQWLLPTVRWDCQVWEKEQSAYALEVHSGIEDHVVGPKLRMENSRVFFVGLKRQLGIQP